MAYSAITDAELESGDPVTVSLMTRLRDNATVGKAPRARVFTSNATFTVPGDCEAIKAIVIGGGGDNAMNEHGSTVKGGKGGSIMIWASVSPGQSLSVNVAAAGGNSRITGIARARAGTDATADDPGERGAVDDIQANAPYIFFDNQHILNGDGHLHGIEETEGIVIIEY